MLLPCTFVGEGAVQQAGRARNCCGRGGCDGPCWQGLDKQVPGTWQWPDLPLRGMTVAAPGLAAAAHESSALVEHACRCWVRTLAGHAASCPHMQANPSVWAHVQDNSHAPVHCIVHSGVARNPHHSPGMNYRRHALGMRHWQWTHLEVIGSLLRGRLLLESFQSLPRGVLLRRFGNGIPKQGVQPRVVVYQLRLRAAISLVVGIHGSGVARTTVIPP